MHPIPLLLVGLAALLLGAPSATWAQITSPAAAPSVAGGDVAGLADISGGHRLWLEGRGRGSPRVMLEAGRLSCSDI